MLSKNIIQIQFFGEKENVFHILVPLMMFCKLSLSHHSLLQCAKEVTEILLILFRFKKSFGLFILFKTDQEYRMRIAFMQLIQILCVKIRQILS